MLARPVHDAAWAQFTTILSAKAAEAGRTLVRVDPRGTSQRCSGCDAEVPKDLSVRVHRCPHCGLTMDRDVNAARNIHRLGQSLREGRPLGLPMIRQARPRRRQVGSCHACRFVVAPRAELITPPHCAWKHPRPQAPRAQARAHRRDPGRAARHRRARRLWRVQRPQRRRPRPQRPRRRRPRRARAPRARTDRPRHRPARARALGQRRGVDRRGERPCSRRCRWWWSRGPSRSAAVRSLPRWATASRWRPRFTSPPPRPPGAPSSRGSRCSPRPPRCTTGSPARSSPACAPTGDKACAPSARGSGQDARSLRRAPTESALGLRARRCAGAREPRRGPARLPRGAAHARAAHHGAAHLRALLGAPLRRAAPRRGRDGRRPRHRGPPAAGGRPRRGAAHGTARRARGAARGARGGDLYRGAASIKAFAAIPVRDGESVRGVFLGDRDDERAFTDEDRAVLEAAALQARRLIDNERVFARLERARSELATLLQRGPHPRRGHDRGAGPRRRGRRRAGRGRLRPRRGRGLEGPATASGGLRATRRSLCSAARSTTTRASRARWSGSGTRCRTRGTSTPRRSTCSPASTRWRGCARRSASRWRCVTRRLRRACSPSRRAAGRVRGRREGPARGARGPRRGGPRERRGGAPPGGDGDHGPDDLGTSTSARWRPSSRSACARRCASAGPSRWWCWTSTSSSP